MPTIQLSLTAKTTKREDDEALRLLAAALAQDFDDFSERMERPAVKKLIDRGVLRFSEHFLEARTGGG